MAFFIHTGLFWYIQPEPDVYFLSPENNSYHSSGVTWLNYSYNVNIGSADTCWYSTDSFSTNTTTNCSENVTGLSSSEGSNYWAICVNDTESQESCNYSNFTIDLTNPKLEFRPSAETNNTWVSDSIVVADLIINESYPINNKRI